MSAVEMALRQTEGWMTSRFLLLLARRIDPKVTALVLKYFPERTRVHFFYAGCGPSGDRWGFSRVTDHYTLEAE